MNIDNLDFNKNELGLIPAIIQDNSSKTVLMLGYMNKESLQKTMDTGYVTFYSRSKKRLWTKGETSGNTLKLDEISMDCDQDTLLIKVQPNGPVCHTGNDTCFSEKNESKPDISFLDDLIEDRMKNPKTGSYTNELLNNINKAAQKVGEEAVELIIEAKDDHMELFNNEAADLLYHYLVLLRAKGSSLKEVTDILKLRHLASR